MEVTSFNPEPLFVHDETEISGGRHIGTFNIKNKELPGAECIWIADVKPYGKKSGQFLEHAEALAYAKLFAASPDLLEALRLALPYVEGAYEAAFPDSDHNDYVLEAIKAAIDKATL